MISYSQYVDLSVNHDHGSKILLNGMTLPAGQSAEQDLDAALDCIFAHPNLPPFIARHLIQQLVESNPSPQYIQRVVGVFKNDGYGVRGNMAAVITAVLMDPEARQDDDPSITSPGGGRLRDPNLWTTAVLRGADASPTEPNISWTWGLSQTAYTMGEIPFFAPTVFGYFSPDYLLPGTTTLAPEFNMETTATIYRRLSDAQQWSGGTGTSSGGYGGVIMDFSPSGSLGATASQGPEALLDYLNLVYMHGKMMPTQRAIIIRAIQGKDPETMTRLAFYLVISSSSYKVQL
jgi:hypothetical protein